MSLNFVTALGPATKLDSLSSFAPDYVTARLAFNDLLVFPHLEVINIDDASTTNLLSLVTDGNNRLATLSNIDIDLARKVISYDATLSALVGSLSVKLLVATMQPVAQEYADHARAESESNQQFFVDFTNYISSVDDRIDTLTASLKQLNDQIDQQSAALESKNIIATLWEVFKTLYKLASTAEASDVQIASILGVTISTITGSFKTLWDDQFRLQKIISSLQGLRNRTSDLKARFVTLSNALKTVTAASRNLLDAWDDVAARMEPISDSTEVVPPAQATQVTNAWASVSSDAQAYIEALQKPTAGVPNVTLKSAQAHRILSAKFNAIPKVPISQAEIALHKLAAQHGREALFASFSLKSDEVLNDSDSDIVEAVLGPPGDTQQKLEKLADDTGRVIDQFNNLLSQPFLDQYKCTSPVDGSDSNLYTVMNFYRNKYTTLQQDTLPVTRNLGAYAALQITLLPTVVPDSKASDTDLKMSVFLQTNAPLVTQYQAQAAALSARSTEVKNEWDNVINLVNKLIAECDENITKWSNSIDDLTEQQKKMTMYAILAAFGAFIAFTAAVFLPGVGMLVALGAGAALGALTVYEAISASKITVAINELQGSITNAKNTKARLQDLLPFCTAIADSLSSVSLIWANITTALSNLNTFYSVLSGPTGPVILDALRPQVINNWTNVQTGVNNYIAAVAK